MENVRGTFVAKGGQREEGSVGALRRKEAGSEIGGGEDEKKAEEGSAGKDRIGRARTGGEEVKEERKVWKKGKMDLERLEGKSKGRKDGKEGEAVKKAVVAKRKKRERRKVKEEGDRVGDVSERGEGEVEESEKEKRREQGYEGGKKKEMV